MKTFDLMVTIRVSAESSLDSLSDTVRELEANCTYHIGDTEHVKVIETELMESPLAYPSKP
jgi:hypothetical protein